MENKFVKQQFNARSYVHNSNDDTLNIYGGAQNDETKSVSKK